MKKHTVEKVITDNNGFFTFVSVVTKDGKTICLSKNKYSRTLKPGDKIGVMYDKYFGISPMVYVYKKNMFMGNAAVCDFKREYKEYAENFLKIGDRIKFDLFVIKKMIQRQLQPSKCK